jgi:hypothetical protein
MEEKLSNWCVFTGKTRYYDQILFHIRRIQLYIIQIQTATSYEAKIWRGKTNMRLGNDALVVNNMTTLLKEQNLKSRLLPMSMPFI